MALLTSPRLRGRDELRSRWEVGIKRSLIPGEGESPRVQLSPFRGSSPSPQPL